MEIKSFLPVAEDLELAGLIWSPEIGDEVCDRHARGTISVLVDPHGMSPTQLRTVYLWLPTVEQMIFQFEARQAILFHAGLELDTSSLCYKTVVQAPVGHIESKAASFRVSVGLALRKLLLSDSDESIH